MLRRCDLLMWRDVSSGRSAFRFAFQREGHALRGPSGSPESPMVSWSCLRVDSLSGRMARDRSVGHGCHCMLGVIQK